MIKVRVPATTANIGPGFDCVGCALSMFAEFTFTKSDEIQIEGCPEKYRNEDNLVLKSFYYTLDYLGKEHFPVKIVIDCPIPEARGLGSSSACIVAGVVGAEQMMGAHLSDEELLSLCTKMEGHPDNVAPAIFGGLVGGFTDDEKTTPVIFGTSRKWNMVTVIPNYHVRTEDARKAIKWDIELKTSIYNTSHILGFVKAIETGDAPMAKKACKDKIHEPYRKALIKDYDAVRNMCDEENTVAFFISGSGSTMIAMLDDLDRSIELCSRLQEAFPEFEVKNLKISREGVTSFVVEDGR